MNKKIKTEISTNINCFVKGLKENIDSKLYAWVDEKIFPNPKANSNPKLIMLIQSILFRFISFIN